MKLQSKEYKEGNYDLYIKKLTKENMQEQFIENFGGWSDKVSENKFYEIIKTGKVVLFFLENVFTGYVSYAVEKNNLESILIHDIHIIEKFKRQGYGKEILKFVINDIKENKITPIKKNKITQIKVFVFKNNSAIKFYLSQNFKEFEFLEKSNTSIMILNIN